MRRKRKLPKEENLKTTPLQTKQESASKPEPKPTSKKPPKAIPKKSKATSKKSTSSPNSRKTKHYTIVGELVVSTSAMDIKLKAGEVFDSPSLRVDGKGNSFGRSALEVDIDGQKKILPLDPRQNELIVKLLRIAPYA